MKKIFSILTLLWMAVTAQAYELAVNTLAHGAGVKFYVNNQEVTTANENDVVTMKISVEGYVANVVTANTYTSWDKANRRADISADNSVTVSGTENERTFTMPAYNVEVTVESWKKLMSNSDITISVSDGWIYNGSALEPGVTVTDQPEGAESATYLDLNTDYSVAYANNVNAGTATVTVTGIGENYTGEKVAEFTINPKNIAVVVFELAETEYTYDGTPKKPGVTGANGELTLTEGTDFTVAYADSVNAGSGTVKVKGIGNYTGSSDFRYTIKPAQVTSVTLAATNLVYTGSEQTAEVSSVKAGDLTLTAEDYDVSDNTATNVGEYTMTVTGKGNFGGTATAKFSIVAADANLFTMTLAEETFTYDGTAKNPAVTVKDGERTLEEGTDYTLAYTNNINVGTATVTVTGVNNYSGTKTAEFTIAAAQVSAVTLAATNLKYTGSEQTAEVSSVKAGDLTLTAEDYDISGNKATNVGEYTVTVTGKGNFAGTATAKFSIVAADANLFTMTLAEETFTYDGTAKTPAVTVKDGEKTLTEGTDYTLAYTNNINVGTATVTVTGKGNYSGTKTAQFTITAAQVTSVTLATTNLQYTGEELTAEVSSVKAGDLALTAADYDVSGNKATAVGEYTLTVTGKGNFTGTASAKFTIAAAQVTAVTLSATNLKYTGAEQTAEVNSVKAGDLTLTAEDYDISGNKATAVGEYTLTVTGKGNFAGTASAKYSIVAADANLFTMTLAEETFTYDGTTKTPAVTVKDGEKTLTEGADYTLAYTNNIDVGTATVTATGKGNYSGTKTAQFTIAAAQITSVTLATTNLKYTGEELTAEVSSVKAGDLALTAEDYDISGNKATAVGEYTLTVTGKGNFTGTASAKYSIVAADANLFTMTLAEETFTYDGKAKTPAVTVKDGEKTLTEGTDYSVAYANNINVGKATVTVTGKGNYSGTHTAEFTIAAAQITAVTLSATNLKYTGAELTAEVNSVKAGDLTLTTEDYTVSGNKATAVGEYTLTVTGKGNFAGTASAKYSIVAADANLFSMTLAEESFIYDGKAKTPAVTVKDGEKTLTEGTDYSVAYANNINVGKATVTVTGKGNYSGTHTAEFTITAAQVSAVTLAATNLKYTGSEQIAEVNSVKAGDLVLTAADYTVSGNKGTNAGEYTLTVTGKGNFAGTATAKFTIAAAQITAVTLAATNLKYTGAELTAEVSAVKAGDLTLTAEDYDVSGNKATAVGEYTLTVTGKGNFAGTASAKYSIVAADANLFSMTLAEESFIYDGKAKTPAVTVKDGDKTLTEGTDYSVAYANNINVGKATVTVTGKGNYSGTHTAEFTITAAQITAVTLSATNLKYTGAELTAEVSSVKAGDLTLTTEDYTVSGNKATAVGEYTLTVTGKGNFAGTASAKYSIVAADANLFTMTLAEESFIYDGKAKTPAVTVKDGDKTLTEGTDYSVAYANNINVGKATVTVTGKGNYSGTHTAEFTITAAQITAVTLAATSLDYTGEELTVEVSSVKAGELTLTTEDYDVSGNKATAVGEYTVTVTGKGNFTGTATAKFSIVGGGESPSGIEMTIAGGEYATYFYAQNISVSGAEVYVVTGVNDSGVEIEKVEGVVPANTPILLKNAAGEEQKVVLTPTDDEAAKIPTTASAMMGTAEPKAMNASSSEKSYYICNGKEFIKMLNAGTLPANRCWLEISATQSVAARRSISIGEGTTGVKETIFENETADAAWYDMNGRKLSGKPARKGLYIHNGRKVVIK